MVVGVLRNGLKSALPVLIIFSFVVSIISLFSTTNSLSDNSINIIYRILTGSIINRVGIVMINILVLVIGAILLSYYSIRQEVVDKQNYLPAFLYLFFGGMTMDCNLLHPSFFANIFIFLFLINITEAYRNEYVLSLVFNAAFFLSLALFFYINYAFFIPLFFICLIILRAFNWREWACGVLGLVAPVFMYACICYLANYDFTEFISYTGLLFYYFQKPLISEFFYPLFFMLIILLIFVVLRHSAVGFGSKIKTQKTTAITYWMIVLTLINFFSKNNNYYFPLIASVIPLSLLLGEYFFSIKKLKVANTLLFLLMTVGSLLFLVKLGAF